MKIAIICNEYPPAAGGGIGTFTQGYAKGLCERGHTVLVVGLGQGGRRGEREENGIRIVDLPACTVPKVAWLADRARIHVWLRRKAMLNEIDLIETPEYGGLFPFPLGIVPVVVRLHISGAILRKQCGLRFGLGVSWCERHTLKNHRNWIGVSHFVLQKTIETFRIRPMRSVVIHNPILRCDLGGGTGDGGVGPHVPEPFVLFVGSGRWESKGAYVLAEACKGVMERREGLHLVYVGRVQGRGALDVERIASTMGRCKDRVHFLGHVPHEKVLSLMKRAAVFASPSQLEAFGLVVVEAMAMGTAVVAGDIPPTREAIEDGRTGLLANPLDAEDIANKIESLLDQPALARKITEQARELVETRFSMKRCVEASLAFYQQCLQDSKR